MEIDIEKGNGYSMEIGSIFEINPNWIENAKKRQGVTLRLKEVEKYGKKNALYTASGRQAISAALKSIEKNRPEISKKCLMPAYMCDTVFFPFEQNGWELVFYHIDTDMRADADEFCKLIENEKPGMLFIHAYYGVDTWKELRPMLYKYQESGLILMEDMTQAYYLHEADIRADYIVGSLRKWYSVPDGGFVTTDEEIYTKLLPEDSYFVEERIKMLTSKWEYLDNVENENGSIERLQAQKSEYLALNRSMEEYLDKNEVVMAISDISAAMLSGINEEKDFRQRNANYKLLYQGFTDRKTVRNVMPKQTEDAAPLYLPVYADNREEIQKFFRENDIYAPVLWPVGMENADILSEDEKYVFSHLLAIPMDHRYGETEMQKIIEVLNEYEELHR